MHLGDVCHRDVIVGRADETIVQAARRMRDFHVGDLVIVSNLTDRRPVGILTDHDIVVGARRRARRSDREAARPRHHVRSRADGTRA